MSQSPAAPAGIDLSVPNVARMYDYYLGGEHHFEADRAAAEQVVERYPQVRAAARANRVFLQRAVRFLAEQQGIDQFIDIGAGLPTQGQVHQVTAHSKVVYVDNDPIVAVHARALLDEPARVTVIEADLRDPDRIIDHPKIKAFIDWDRPVAVLLLAVLHFIPDSQNPDRIMGRLREAMAPGSYLALSHATWDGDASSASDRAAATSLYQRSSGDSAARPRAEIARFFTGFTLVSPGSQWDAMVDPGLVWLPQWGATAPVTDPHLSMAYCGVGRRDPVD